MIGGVLSVLIGVIVGIIVYYKVAAMLTGMNLPAAAVTAAANVNTTANTTFTLMPIVAIILIAGIILSVVNGFGRGGS